MNPYDKAHELARAIRECEEFRVLAAKKKQVDSDPQAKKILDDFRRRQWEMETRRIMGEEITESDLQSMQQLQEVVHMHSALREYLEVEYRFSVMYSDIHKILGEAAREVINTPESV
ncbi:YlbF family regulator [Tumebacillus sp. ITR2]|uniref:YlbF family regulator n=1 Tax=Tumebacillus amylolyticus TaxID=2801339 RepID=A0ABS1J7J3_9BACL|nr:YlbF family regulator [Tumebacillus amylolyticus]MBL0386246.1 YlbF family regulator [Tumebacillus amylolyticus]